MNDEIKEKRNKKKNIYNLINLRLRTLGISGSFRLFLSMHPVCWISDCTLVCVVSIAFELSSSLTPHPFTIYLLSLPSPPTLFTEPWSSNRLPKSLLQRPNVVVVEAVPVTVAFEGKMVDAVVGPTNIFDDVADCRSISGDLSSSWSEESDFDDG